MDIFLACGNSYNGGSSWTESYGYDPSFDYLTSANYGDGLPNASQNWTYDAAGNRNDSVCDNLNRPTSIGGVACTSDILGNRLSTGSTSMGWDCLNRMTSLTNSSGTNTYTYRADGMRVSKASGSNGTLYRYDGQMGIEDVDTGAHAAVTDYALGARGVDGISKTANGTTTLVYPVYDGHGNMVCDLSRSGTSFSLNDKRSFDAWGNIRSGASTGDPKGRYCASLGHKQDDESGLVYMRARYYEPSSGRFLSVDPEEQGINWYAYCCNRSINKGDYSGCASFGDLLSGSLETASEMLQELVQANSTMNWVEERIMGVLFDWAVQFEELLGSDGFGIFGGEDLQFGVKGKFMINFHFSDVMMDPHNLPHMELDIMGASQKIYAWFTEYGVTYGEGGWSEP